jgi:hypothetical protein
MTEQPIVGLGEIAKFLRVGEVKAREMLKKARVPLLEPYKPLLAVMPSDLIECLRLDKAGK